MFQTFYYQHNIWCPMPQAGQEQVQQPNTTIFSGREIRNSDKTKIVWKQAELHNYGQGNWYRTTPEHLKWFKIQRQEPWNQQQVHNWKDYLSSLGILKETLLLGKLTGKHYSQNCIEANQSNWKWKKTVVWSCPQTTKTNNVQRYKEEL